MEFLRNDCALKSTRAKDLRDRTAADPECNLMIKKRGKCAPLRIASVVGGTSANRLPGTESCAFSTEAKEFLDLPAFSPHETLRKFCASFHGGCAIHARIRNSRHECKQT
ncbi:MAG: hypothetical protein CMO80_16770 [Verrucomicrobiales bacterium]|nr:hypothetical protein [Verrucomicrobiales bacterium]